MLAFRDRLIYGAFASGPLPTRIGMILDGNRRWARLRGQSTLDGYDAGIAVMAEVLQKSLHIWASVT